MIGHHNRVALWHSGAGSTVFSILSDVYYILDQISPLGVYSQLVLSFTMADVSPVKDVNVQEQKVPTATAPKETSSNLNPLTKT